MGKVRKWLESEEQFKEMKLSFYYGRKIPYFFKIISYKEDKPEKLLDLQLFN